MPAIYVIIEKEPSWPDLVEKVRQGQVIHLSNETPWEIATLGDGTVSGQPSICLRLDLPDGRTVVAETTLRAFQAANAALEGKYGVLP